MNKNGSENILGKMELYNYITGNLAVSTNQLIFFG
jgi:hypothetical protein